MPRRREGPVRNRQTGYYFIDEYIGFGIDKHRIRYSLRTKDPEKAHFLWEREYRRLWRVYYGDKTPERPVERHLADVAREYTAYARDIKHVKGWRTIEGRLRIVSECFGDIRLAEIDHERISKLDAYLRNLKPPRSAKTINDYMGLLRTMFNYAIRRKYVSENPVSEIKPYTVDSKRREYTPAEIQRLLEAAEKVERDALSHSILQRYIKRIILLLLYTGMRMGELLNLRWDNIQGDKVVIKRTETKQKKEKVIPLTPAITAVLEELREPESVYVIPRRRSVPATKTVLRKMREVSGIEDFDFHSLRHTAASVMVSRALGRGVGISDIMAILGHSRVDTTMRYVHSDFGRMRKAMKTLEKNAVFVKVKNPKKSKD